MEHENGREQDFQNRELDFSGFGDLPEDLRSMGPVSEDGKNYSYTRLWEGDNFAFPAGTPGDRQFMEPIPEGFGPTANVSEIRFLPRYNYESFRSQQTLASGLATLSPSSGATFTTLASFTVPAGFSGVLTGIAQWIGDATAYNKPDGTADDVSWRIVVGGTGAASYSSISLMLSDLTSVHRLYVILNESITIELSATNNIASGSFGARSIPVKGYLIGYQFPIDEVDDIFRSR